jgi:hypothetical protein
LIVASLLVCTALGAAAGIFLPEVYEATFDLRIARVWDKPMENPYRAAEIINGEPFLDAVRKRATLAKTARQLKEDGDVRATATTGTRTPDGQEAVLVRVVTRAGSPDEAVMLAETVAEIIIEEHTPHFNELVAENTRYQTELEAQVQTIRDEIGELDALIKQQRVKPEVDAPAVILLQAQLEQKQTQVLEALREVWELKINNTSTAYTHNTYVVFPPVRPEEPVNLPATSTAVIGAVVGLVAAVVLALLVNYVGSARGHEQRAQTSRE